MVNGYASIKMQTIKNQNRKLKILPYNNIMQNIYDYSVKFSSFYHLFQIIIKIKVFKIIVFANFTVSPSFFGTYSY